MSTKKTKEKKIENIFICGSSDLHPYECDGMGKCIHCDREKSVNHKPALCALCEDDIVVDKRKIIKI